MSGAIIDVPATLEIVTPPPRPLPTAAALARHGDVCIDWPLVIIVSGRVIQEAAVEDLTGLTDELFALETSFAFVFDFTRLEQIPGARVRKRAADYQRRHAAEFRRWIRADATVVRSALTRGMMTAMSWLITSSHNERLFGTRAEAEAWARVSLASPDSS